jgi:hypothetical protein
MLALHPASEKNPAGKVELGFTVADVEAFYRDMSAKGVLFSMPPKKQDFGACSRSSSIPREHIAAVARRRRSSRHLWRQHTNLGSTALTTKLTLVSLFVCLGLRLHAWLLRTLQLVRIGSRCMHDVTKRCASNKVKWITSHQGEGRFRSRRENGYIIW